MATDALKWKAVKTADTVQASQLNHEDIELAMHTKHKLFMSHTLIAAAMKESNSQKIQWPMAQQVAMACGHNWNHPLAFLHATKQSSNAPNLCVAMGAEHTKFLLRCMRMQTHMTNAKLEWNILPKAIFGIVDFLSRHPKPFFQFQPCNLLVNATTNGAACLLQ